jgi:HSP20 family molecular chaperone IbpA
MWMWAEACEALERAERLQRQFFRLSASLAARPLWEPPVDVYETAGDVWLLVALPGADPSRIEIRLDAGALIVSGERALPAELRAAVIHRLEIPHGWFERRIELPAGRFELDQRSFVHGCLVLRLRKLT